MSKFLPKERSKLWQYRLRTAIWVDAHLLDPKNVRWVKAQVLAEDMPRRKLPDFYANLGRDYPGTWYLPFGIPGWPDLDCLSETDGLDCWLRDWPHTESDVVKHPVAIRRVRTLGSIYAAYAPIPSLYHAVKEATLEDRYCEDWEEVLRVHRSRPNG